MAQKHFSLAIAPEPRRQLAQHAQRGDVGGARRQPLAQQPLGLGQPFGLQGDRRGAQG